MRMQFWRQAIASAFAGQPPAEPVAVLLHHVLAHDHAPLSKSFLLKLIGARVREPPPLLCFAYCVAYVLPLANRR